MAILITGGAGFLGSKIAEYYLKRGEEVVVFSRSAGPNHKGAIKGVVYERGDIKSWHEVLNVLKRYRIKSIFHLAAMLTLPSEENPWASIETNAVGTYNILEGARLFDVKKVIFSSSIGTYGVSEDTVVDEDTPQRPANIYGCCKVFGEHLGLYYHRRFDIDFRGLRVPQIVGPGVKTPGIGQYIPWLIEAAIKGEPFDVWVPEDFIQPMLYVKDVVRGFVMLHDAREDTVGNRVYNMGQITPAPKAKELVQEVKKHLPQADIRFKPDPSLLPILKTIPKDFRGEKARVDWGWYPEYGLEDMVSDFIEEYKRMG
ncbi:MAG: NAD(P)-dependent oxidoreductase [Syntrophorhabdaceae bacterium]|nr:NAD(P)-dependent oxidoreductase [Syntrophorhabdaceae bacterium]